MQFKVPQDVQREDTIIGPITLKQLAILGVGGGIAYIIYISLAANFFIEIWLPPIAIILILTLSFAFLKIHNLPFYEFLMHLIEYHVLPKKRTWIQGSGYPFVSSFQKEQMKKKETKTKKTEEKEGKIDQKNLKELSEILDSQGKTKIKK